MYSEYILLETKNIGEKRLKKFYLPNNEGKITVFNRFFSSPSGR
jgi:hypothetical protein